MLPSQVRQLILDDHHWLRAFLADVEEVARRVEEGDHQLAGRLRERALAMSERFLRHLELEEEQLVPALLEADAWGEERAGLLLREHSDQRERFGSLLHDLRSASRDVAASAREVRLLVRDLLTDMAHEERELLSRKILHDDPVVVDGEPE